MRKTIIGWAAALIYAGSAAAAPLPAPRRADQQQFLSLYKELVETNTSLSVGSCTLAAERMAARLKAAGFADSQLTLFADPEHPKEGGLVAVYPGTSTSVKPLLLIAHIDVVEAKREDWARDPFTLVEENGNFYARGAADDKAMAAVLTDNLIRYKKEGFKPRLTEAGQRHPVTAGLPGANTKTGEPEWGRWFRLVRASVLGGSTLMSGAQNQPLLVLDRVQKGRVALLLSDHAWLWTRGFEGGGPQAELLRRLAHWLMKEPDLEEERLSAAVRGDRLIITRRTMADSAATVSVTYPSGRVETVTLAPSEGGVFSGTLKAEEMGLYRLKDEKLTAVAAAGPLNPKELSDVRATDAILKPIVAGTDGGISWIKRDGIPEIRRVKPNRVAAGDGWIGLRANESYAVRAVRQTPLFHPAIALILIVGSLLLGWHREGR